MKIEQLPNELNNHRIRIVQLENTVKKLENTTKQLEDRIARLESKLASKSSD